MIAAQTRPRSLSWKEVGHQVAFPATGASTLPFAPVLVLNQYSFAAQVAIGSISKRPGQGRNHRQPRIYVSVAKNSESTYPLDRCRYKYCTQSVQSRSARAPLSLSRTCEQTKRNQIRIQAPTRCAPIEGSAFDAHLEIYFSY
jgi:hypothetical protein